jgi:hypothetical protein
VPSCYGLLAEVNRLFIWKMIQRKEGRESYREKKKYFHQICFLIVAIEISEQVTMIYDVSRAVTLMLFSFSLEIRLNRNWTLYKALSQNRTSRILNRYALLLPSPDKYA